MERKAKYVCDRGAVTSWSEIEAWADAQPDDPRDLVQEGRAQRPLLPSTTTLLAILYCCKTRQGWFHGYQLAKDWGTRWEASQAWPNWVSGTLGRKCICSKGRVTQISSPCDRGYCVHHLKDQFPGSSASLVCFKNRLHLRCRMKAAGRTA